MKPKLLAFLFLIACSIPVLAQTDLPKASFNWNDTVFTRNAIHKIGILYDLDKVAICCHSEDTLNLVVKFMKANPFIKIAVDVYTDPRGSEKHNMVLSQLRAQECVNYLISNGIDSARLVAKGWGFHKPLPGCSAIDIAKMKTPEEKRKSMAGGQKNRSKNYYRFC